MRSHPKMWASNRESFVNRALTILEMTGIKNDTFFQECLTVPGKTFQESLEYFNYQFDNSWAVRVIDKAMFLLKG